MKRKKHGGNVSRKNGLYIDNDEWLERFVENARFCNRNPWYTRYTNLPLRQFPSDPWCLDQMKPFPLIRTQTPSSLNFFDF